VIGYYDGDKLMYVARTRNGFTPASRAELFKKIKPAVPDFERGKIEESSQRV